VTAGEKKLVSIGSFVVWVRRVDLLFLNYADRWSPLSR